SIWCTNKGMACAFSESNEYECLRHVAHRFHGEMKEQAHPLHVFAIDCLDALQVMRVELCAVKSAALSNSHSASSPRADARNFGNGHIIFHPPLVRWSLET